MGEIIFEGGKIQVGDRIKIPKPIVDTLRLKKGQRVSIRFNPDKKEMILDLTKEGRK
jgi:bifunctional DNA-binding transcriptional regulator/antitoxin component of YhaV-PrlF toxin-antitoxin module